MAMDDGSEIQGLDESWSFAGAKLTEWTSGLAMALVVNELFLGNAVRSMPFFLGTMIGTPLLLAAIRRSFPDEERGLRNFLCSVFGIAPPGMPAPAQFQPVWSGAPLRELSADGEFRQLKLDQVFASAESEED